jgi:hypothetical protein
MTGNNQPTGHAVVFVRFLNFVSRRFENFKIIGLSVVASCDKDLKIEDENGRRHFLYRTV